MHCPSASWNFYTVSAADSGAFYTVSYPGSFPYVVRGNKPGYEATVITTASQP